MSVCVMMMCVYVYCLQTTHTHTLISWFFGCFVCAYCESIVYKLRVCYVPCFFVCLCIVVAIRTGSDKHFKMNESYCNMP